MNNKSRKAEKSAGAPAWMMTYGDLVTQMLTFFILLFTFSTLDAIKFRDAVISLQGAFGVLSGGTQILNLSDMPTNQPNRIETSPMVKSNMLEVKATLDAIMSEKQVEQAVENANQAQYLEQIKVEDEKEEEGVEKKERLITTLIDEQGLRIRFTDPILFDLGSADLRHESVDMLRDVADVIANIPNEIIVEGHTDNIPIRTSRFKSNWDLSAGRACEVLRFLIQEGGVNPERMAAAGYGEEKPLVPNDTKENRQKNRRVEILILKEDLPVENK